MSASHTPGPWSVIHDPARTVIDIEPEYSPFGRVATISPVDGQEDGGRSHSIELANARLIAAAPELLDVAKAIAAEWQRSPNIPYPQRETLRAAIAKAEGRA
jgi:hypothetical protein